MWNQVLVALLVLGRDGAPRTLTSSTERRSWPAPARFFGSPSVSAFSCYSAVSGRRGCNGNAWSDGVDYPRCPDGDGFFDDTRVALGHRRLAIIDRAGGHQPMANEDGTCWIVLYLPLGSLGRAYEAGPYPFGAEQVSRRWREPLETWLADLGQFVYSRAAFRFGLIGLRGRIVDLDGDPCIFRKSVFDRRPGVERVRIILIENKFAWHVGRSQCL